MVRDFIMYRNMAGLTLGITDAEFLWEIRVATLIIMVCFAVIDDYRRFRISNEIIAAGCSAACLVAVVSCVSGGVNNIGADMLLGGVIGFLAGMALYAVRGIGAGDVKLLMACTMLIGREAAPAMLAACLVWGLIAGGVELLIGSGRRAVVNGVSMHATHFSAGILLGNLWVLITR